MLATSGVVDGERGRTPLPQIFLAFAVPQMISRQGERWYSRNAKSML